MCATSMPTSDTDQSMGRGPVGSVEIASESPGDAMFDVAERERIQSVLVARAEHDERIASAALVGSLATDQADQWSDIDLTFGVAHGTEPADVIADWSQDLASDFAACTLLDLYSGGAQYRVFLMPGCLQVDLSFAPGAGALQSSPRFRLLFGVAGEMQTTGVQTKPQSPDDTFGWGVLYARYSYVCIQRRHWWQAAHYIAAVRDAAMNLACLAHQLPASFGKGYDRLPADVLRRFEPTLCRSTSRDDLGNARRAATATLIEHGAAVPWAANVQADLIALSSA